MYKNPYRGKFIVFEGLDGSGQTTQVRLLGDFLQGKDYPVVLTKEPTSLSQAGRTIQEILDQKRTVSPGGLQELFAEDRKEHLEKLIIPGLKEGKIIISDRYFFSSFAYGSIDLDLDWLVKLNDEFLMPDLTIFLDLKPEICLKRIQKRDGGKRMLFEEREKLEKVWKAYRTFPSKFKSFCQIDGEQSKEEVFKKVKKTVEHLLCLP